MRWVQFFTSRLASNSQLLPVDGAKPNSGWSRFILRVPAAATAVLLAVEFSDEFAFGLREAAWPQVRTDLALNYAYVGLLLSIPGVTSSVLEVPIGVLADIGRRRALIAGGGVLFALALLWAALSTNVWSLLAAFILLYPASGAFVSLSQASLMDSAPARHEQNMVRWTFAGSVGVVAGSVVFAGGALVGISWRWLFAGAAILSLVLALAMARARLAGPDSAGKPASFMAGLLSAARAMKQLSVMRWLVLLQASDLVSDVFLGFIALYFVDIAGASPAQAALAVTVWTVAGLAGELALVRLLERVRGTDYLRVSAVLTAFTFIAFLLCPGLWPKLALLGTLGLLNAGWYSILQAQVYTAMPGRSGTVVSVTSAAGIAGGVLPLAVGAFAGAAGLEPAMWLLLAGPVVLLLGLAGHTQGG